MKENNYVITGIAKEQIQEWKDELRDDLTLCEHNETIIPVITLNRREAFKLRIAILQNNLKQGTKYGVKRI